MMLQIGSKLEPLESPLTISRWVTAGPCSGKSYLLGQLLLRGVFLVDTDILTKVLDPTYFPQKKWQRPGKENDPRHAAFRRAMGRATGRIYNGNPKAVVVTNLWNDQFASGLDAKAARASHDIGVFRSEVEDVLAVSKQRGGDGFTEELVQKWINSWKATAPYYFNRVVWLGKGEYLSDAIKLPFKDMGPSIWAEPLRANEIP